MTYLVIFESPRDTWIAEFTDFVKARAAYEQARRDIADVSVGVVRFATQIEEATSMNVRKEIGAAMP